MRALARFIVDEFKRNGEMNGGQWAEWGESGSEFGQRRIITNRQFGNCVHSSGFGAHDVVWISFDADADADVDARLGYGACG